MFSKPSPPRRVIISYVLDYVILIVLLIFFTAIDAVEPFHQHFSLQNYTLQYPHAVKERVPYPLALVLCVLLPIGVITLYTLVLDGIFSHRGRAGQQGPSRVLRNGVYSFKERLWELNCGILGLLLSVGFTLVVTATLKSFTGKPRPDLIDRCQPKDGSVDPPVFGLSSIEICQQTNHKKLKDGFRSFPSGHSSSAFAGLFYLSLYLAGKLRVLDNRGEVWKLFVVLLPSLGASLIADSRIMDARHHPFDVITGSMLGIFIAWCSYRQYFPPLNDTQKKGRAYPIRTWGHDPHRDTVPNSKHTHVESSQSHLPTSYDHVDEEQNGDAYEMRPPHRVISPPTPNTTTTSRAFQPPKPTLSPEPRARGALPPLTSHSVSLARSHSSSRPDDDDTYSFTSGDDSATAYRTRPREMT